MKASDQPKRVPFTLLLDPAEKVAWESEAKALGLTLASFIRVTVNQRHHQTTISPMVNHHMSEPPPATIEPPSNHHQTNGESTVVRGAIGGSSSLPLPFVPVVGVPSTPSEKTKTSRRAPPQPDPDFERFWSTWPRKDAKKPALAAWHRAKREGRLPPVDKLVEIVRWQTTAKDWPSQYTPLPATWLNGDRWEDEAQDYDAPRPPSPRQLAEEEVRELQRRLCDLTSDVLPNSAPEFEATMDLHDAAGKDHSLIPALKARIGELAAIRATMSAEDVLAVREESAAAMRAAFSVDLSSVILGGT